MKHRISHKKYNGHRVYKNVYDPLNPLDLPPFTLRLKFVDDYTPEPWAGVIVQVSSSPNVWDYTVVQYGNSWRQLLMWAYGNLIEVLGANSTNVTDMSEMFAYSNSNLTSVALFDTSNVSSMSWMFNSCSSLTSIPLFDTSKVTQMDFAFNGCTNVQSGALALYQQASTQQYPPTNHLYTFSNCGINTQTGSAELAQIPDSWK
jgi:surface protein